MANNLLSLVNRTIYMYRGWKSTNNAEEYMRGKCFVIFETNISKQKNILSIQDSQKYCFVILIKWPLVMIR